MNPYVYCTITGTCNDPVMQDSIVAMGFIVVILGLFGLGFTAYDTLKKIFKEKDDARSEQANGISEIPGSSETERGACGRKKNSVDKCGSCSCERE